MTAAPESWAMNLATRKSMQSNRGRDTSFELRVRRELHRRGLRYRVDTAPLARLRSRVDILFPGVRIAVYLDGCFWHACPIHGVTPNAHADHWAPKLAANKQRDVEAVDALQAAGWTVLRFWEHEDNAAVVSTIEAAVREASGRRRSR